MINRKDYMDELKAYIQNNLKKGYTKESLKWALVKQGYSKPIIIKAFRQVDQELAHQAPELKTKPKITYEIVEPKQYKIKVTNQEPKASFWNSLRRLFKR